MNSSAAASTSRSDHVNRLRYVVGNSGTGFSTCVAWYMDGPPPTSVSVAPIRSGI